MCNTDEKTRQYYTILFLYRATKCPTEAEKIGFAKTQDELIMTSEDKNETKYNSTSFLLYND